MADLDDLAASIPIDQIAERLGEDPAAVRQAVDAALPALFGGLQANAQDPGGAASLEKAVGQHDPAVATAPVNIDDVDPADGQAIARHVFGAQQDEVVARLGGVGGSSDLIAKVIPILAPIVLSYLAKQTGGTGGGMLGSILSQVLTGAAQGSGGSRSSGSAVGSILGDLLGGLLGGGRKG